MSKLANKVAVVTGASKGIGAGIAKAFAAEGAAVVVNYASSKEGADKVVDAISKAGGTVVAVGANVSKAAEAQALVDSAVKHFGRLDILVNNSGVYRFATLDSITEEDFHHHFNVNVLGVLLTTQAALKYLPEGSSIINIGSLASRLTPPSSVIYTGTKGALDAVTGVLAKELGPRGIRVNSINPGMVETEATISRAFVGSDIAQVFVDQSPIWLLGHQAISRQLLCSLPPTTLAG
jgi:3-oxoacyl-[acyl-carrier protein] reductase